MLRSKRMTVQRCSSLQGFPKLAIGRARRLTGIHVPGFAESKQGAHGSMEAAGPGTALGGGGL
jgi:hypothetical protein